MNKNTKTMLLAGLVVLIFVVVAVAALFVLGRFFRIGHIMTGGQ